MLSAKVEEKQDVLDRSDHDTFQALSSTSHALKGALSTVIKSKEARFNYVASLKRSITDHTVKCRDIISRKRFLSSQLAVRSAQSSEQY